MASSLLRKFLRKPPGPFVQAARKRKLSTRVARALEPAASEIAFVEPEGVLESRELFEMVAMRAAIEDARRLELSFALVDELAGAVETLGLVESADELTPFSRVWIESPDGGRMRGAIFTCRGEEVAVFCPPTRGSIGEVGGTVKLNSRGVPSPCEHELRLNDAVRLPSAYVLHLTQVDEPGE